MATMRQAQLSSPSRGSKIRRVWRSLLFLKRVISRRPRCFRVAILVALHRFMRNRERVKHFTIKEVKHHETNHRQSRFAGRVVRWNGYRRFRLNRAKLLQARCAVLRSRRSVLQVSTSRLKIQINQEVTHMKKLFSFAARLVQNCTCENCTCENCTCENCTCENCKCCG